MELVKIITSQYGSYIFKDATNDQMAILADFLLSDVGFYSSSSFKKYAFNDWEKYTSSNATASEKINGNILLKDLYPEEEYEDIVVKMTQQQFVKLLDD